MEFRPCIDIHNGKASRSWVEAFLDEEIVQRKIFSRAGCVFLEVILRTGTKRRTYHSF